MAIQDSIPITTLERTVSNDIVQAQDLINRQISEMLSALKVRSVQGNIPTTTPTIALATSLSSGLIARNNGGLTIAVSTGILGQSVPANPPDVPTPGTFDSDYRFGLQMAEETVADPWDTTARFWLLEARVVLETTLSEFRDIFNPATLVFAPSGAALDKRYESQIEYQWIPGTIATIPAATATWAPIAAVYRPAIYAAIDEQYVWPVNIQLEDVAGSGTASGRCRRSRYFCRSVNGIGRVSDDFEIDFEAEVAGAKVHARTIAGGTVQLKNLMVESASSVALQTADTWGYVYLAPFTDMVPKKNHYGEADLEVNGFIITSRTPPNEHGTNSIALLTAAPFQCTIPIGGAAHVGLIRSDGAGIGCRSMSVSSEGRGRITGRLLANGVLHVNAANVFGETGSPWNLAVLGPGGTEDVPYGVQLKCFMAHTRIDAAATAQALEITIGMGSALGTADDVTVPGAWPRMIMDKETLQSKEFDLYPNGNLSMIVNYIPRSNVMADSGGGAGDGGALDFNIGMHGFQF